MYIPRRSSNIIKHYRLYENEGGGLYADSTLIYPMTFTFFEYMANLSSLKKISASIKDAQKNDKSWPTGFGSNIYPIISPYNISNGAYKCVSAAMHSNVLLSNYKQAIQELTDIIGESQIKDESVEMMNLFNQCNSILSGNDRNSMQQDSILFGLRYRFFCLFYNYPKIFELVKDDFDNFFKTVFIDYNMVSKIISKDYYSYVNKVLAGFIEYLYCKLYVYTNSNHDYSIEILNVGGDYPITAKLTKDGVNVSSDEIYKTLKTYTNRAITSGTEYRSEGRPKKTAIPQADLDAIMQPIIKKAKSDVVEICMSIEDEDKQKKAINDFIEMLDNITISKSNRNKNEKDLIGIINRKVNTIINSAKKYAVAIKNIARKDVANRNYNLAGRFVTHGMLFDNEIPALYFDCVQDMFNGLTAVFTNGKVNDCTKLSQAEFNKIISQSYDELFVFRRTLLEDEENIMNNAYAADWVRGWSNTMKNKLNVPMSVVFVWLPGCNRGDLSIRIDIAEYIWNIRKLYFQCKAARLLSGISFMNWLCCTDTKKVTSAISGRTRSNDYVYRITSNDFVKITCDELSSSFTTTLDVITSDNDFIEISTGDVYNGELESHTELCYIDSPDDFNASDKSIKAFRLKQLYISDSGEDSNMDIDADTDDADDK